jgi:hypothetical protein
LILGVDFCNIYLIFLHTKSLRNALSFSTFSSFLQELAFQCSKSEFKNLPFVFAFGFSTFQLKKPPKKKKQTGPKSTRKPIEKLVKPTSLLVQTVSDLSFSNFEL